MISKEELDRQAEGFALVEKILDQLTPTLDGGDNKLAVEAMFMATAMVGIAGGMSVPQALLQLTKAWQVTLEAQLEARKAGFVPGDDKEH